MPPKGLEIYCVQDLTFIFPGHSRAVWAMRFPFSGLGKLARSGPWWFENNKFQVLNKNKFKAPLGTNFKSFAKLRTVMVRGPTSPVSCWFMVPGPRVLNVCVKGRGGSLLRYQVLISGNQGFTWREDVLAQPHWYGWSWDAGAKCTMQLANKWHDFVRITS